MKRNLTIKTNIADRALKPFIVVETINRVGRDIKEFVTKKEAEDFVSNNEVIISLVELKVLGILLPEYIEYSKMLWSGLISEEEMDDMYGEKGTSLRTQLDILSP